MKKKTTIISTAVIAVILLLVIIPAALGSGSSTFFSLGKARTSELESKDNKNVVASYKDNQITKSMIEYQHKVYELSVKEMEANGFSSEEMIQMGITEKTDLEIVNNILCGFLLLEESEKLGFAATEDEIEEWMTSQKQLYKENPGAAGQIDSFCKGAGITIDEYWKLRQEEAYSTLSREKLKTHMKEEYQLKYGSLKGEYSQEEVSAYNAAYDEFFQNYRSGLLEAHSAHIVYYNLDTKITD